MSVSLRGEIEQSTLDASSAWRATFFIVSAPVDRPRHQHITKREKLATDEIEIKRNVIVFYFVSLLWIYLFFVARRAVRLRELRLFCFFLVFYFH